MIKISRIEIMVIIFLIIIHKLPHFVLTESFSQTGNPILACKAGQNHLPIFLSYIIYVFLN